MSVIKRIYKLQKMKCDMMFDTIVELSKILAENYQNIPNKVLEQCTDVFEKFLYANERIDNVREKNMNNFYNKLRNSYEGLYNMEVQDGKENEEEN